MCTRYDVGTCARQRAYLHGWRTRASTCSARRACPCMHAPDLNSLCIAPQALKVDPKGLPTLPAHPPNIRPYDDYFTEHRAKFLERHTRPTTGAAADGANRTSGGRMPADESFWDKAMKEWDASFETREWVRIAPPDGASRIQPQVIDWRDDGGVQSYRGQSRRFRSDEPGVIRPLNVSGRSASAPRAHVENEKDKSTHADSGAS